MVVGTSQKRLHLPQNSFTSRQFHVEVAVRKVVSTVLTDFTIPHTQSEQFVSFVVNRASYKLKIWLFGHFKPFCPKVLVWPVNVIPSLVCQG